MATQRRAPSTDRCPDPGHGIPRQAHRSRVARRLGEPLRNGVRSGRRDARSRGTERQVDGTRRGTLSGGQKQRLSIACALVHEPEIVVLDEPTAALDPQARRNLWDLIGEIRSRGATVVITTHYMDEADALCDRVAIMDHGKILALDAPGALRRDLDARYGSRFRSER